LVKHKIVWAYGIGTCLGVSFGGCHITFYFWIHLYEFVFEITWVLCWM